MKSMIKKYTMKYSNLLRDTTYIRTSKFGIILYMLGWCEKTGRPSHAKLVQKSHTWAQPKTNTNSQTANMILTMLI